MRKLLISILGPFLLLLLAGCTLYRADLQQGNVIDKEELDKLKIGMSKQQINFLLGTPLLVDPFHKDRWDYVYTLKTDNQRLQVKKHLTLIFSGDTLAQINNSNYPNN